MDTEVDVPNPSLVLVPGMYAEVELSLERRNSVLSIPIPAIAGSEGNPQAYVVTPQNKIEVRHIALGLESANAAEVKSGLSDGEMVIVGNRSQLTSGQSVVPKVTKLSASKAE